MPPVGAALVAVGGFISGGVAAVSAVTGLSTAIVGNLAAGLLLTTASSLLTGGGGTPSVNLSQKLQSQISQGQPQFVVVGRTALAGHLSYDGTQGGDNDTEHLTHVVILSYKPINSIVNIHVNGQAVTFTGDVTAAELEATNPEFQGETGSRLRVRVFKGRENVNEGLGLYLASFFPNDFNITTNFGDYAVAVVQIQKTDDDFVEVDDEFVNRSPFQSPPRYRFEVEGASVFDARDPAQSHDDETTWVYSNNSALIENAHDIGWFSGTRVSRLLVGSGYPYALLDEEQVKENADFCDANGFTCNGILVSASQTDAQHIRATYSAVRYEDPGLIYSVPRTDRPYAGAVDLTESRVQHIDSFDAWGRASRVPNALQTRYSNPDTLYEEEVLEYFSDQSQVDADGGIVKSTELDLRMVTDAVIATDLRTISVAHQRRSKTLTLSGLPPYYSGLKGGSVIDVLGSGNPLIESVQWAVNGVGQDEELQASLSLSEVPLPDELITNPSDAPAISSGVSITANINTFVVPGFFGGGGDLVPPFILLNIVENLVEGTSPISSVGQIDVSGNFVPPLTYLWEHTFGSLLTLGDNTDPETSFSGVAGDEAVYRLSVFDSSLLTLSWSDDVTIRII